MEQTKKILFKLALIELTFFDDAFCGNLKLEATCGSVEEYVNCNKLPGELRFFSALRERKPFSEARPTHQTGPCTIPQSGMKHPAAEAAHLSYDSQEYP
jgi:hypothetical protein